MTLEFQSATVLDLKKQGQSGFLLELAYPFAWDPGQVVALAFSSTDQPRFYSLVASARPNSAQILFTLVDGGLITPRLAVLTAGDSLLVSQPFGSFRDQAGSAVWIANGTGVAPFYSMLQRPQPGRKILVQGSRNQAELFFRAEFSTKLAADYVPCCSQDSGPGLYSGRLTTWLRQQTWPTGMQFLLCGSAAMIVDVRDILIAQGVAFDHILSEIYF